MRRQLMRLAIENAFINVNHPPSAADASLMSFRKEFGHLYPTPPIVINHIPLSRPYMALEEIANGEPVKEIEHTIYARVSVPSELERAASKEHQEQWEIRIEKSEANAGKGSMRVRKTWIDGQDPVYVRTAKVVMNDKGDKIELPLPSNKDEFTVFKFLAGQGMKKDRFTFPIVGTDLKWEIDMFPKADGSGYHEWCKIDLEVRDREQPIPEFPIALEDVILPKGYGRQDEVADDAKVGELYEQIFTTKNEFAYKPTTTPATAGDQGIAVSEPVENQLQNDAGNPSPSPAEITPLVTAQPDTVTETPPAATPATPQPDPEETAGGTEPHQELEQTLQTPNPENLKVETPEDGGEVAGPGGSQGVGDATPDPTEDGKVPVDLIMNPEGDQTVAKEPNGTTDENAADADITTDREQPAEADTSSDTGTDLGAEPDLPLPESNTNAESGDAETPDENSDENGVGTGDGLGQDLEIPKTPEEADAANPNAQGASGDIDPDDTQGEGGTADTGNAMNGDGETTAEATGETVETTAKPAQAEPDELPPENAQRERRPEEAEAEQKQ